MEKTKLDQALNNVEVYYERYKPDDPDFLESEEGQGVVEEMERLEKMERAKDSDKLRVLDVYADFITEWFPDSVEEEEQEEIENAIDFAREVIRENKQAM